MPSLDDKTQGTAGFTPIALKNGIYTATIAVETDDGRRAETSWTFTMLGPDDEGPSFSCDATGTYESTATFTISAKDWPEAIFGGSGLRTFNWDVDTAQPFTGGHFPDSVHSVYESEGKVRVTVDPPQWGIVTHNVYAWGDDKLDNSTPKSIVATFAITAPPDSIPPTSTCDVAASYTGTASILFSAVDNPTGWGIGGRWIRWDPGSSPIVWAESDSPLTKGSAVTTVTPEATITLLPVGHGGSSGIIRVLPPVHDYVDRTFEYWALDRAQNSETPHHFVTFRHYANPDSTAPNTTCTVQPWYATPTGFSLTATDNAGGWGVDKIRYRVDGGSVQEGVLTTASAGGFYTIVQTGGHGKHTLEYWATDKAGNSETTKTATYTVDSVAPTTTYVSPTTVTGDTTVTLSAADNVDGIGVKYTWFKIDGGATTTGTAVRLKAPQAFSVVRTISFWSADKLNNTEIVKTQAVTVWAPPDTVAPTTTSDRADNYLKPSSISLTATDNPGGWGVAKTFYRIDDGPTVEGLSAPTGGAGNHKIEFWSTDKAENTETANVGYYYVQPDSTPPVTTSNGVSLYFGPATIKLTATDIGWGVKNTYYKLNNEATQTGTTINVAAPVAGSSSNTIKFWSDDQAGNVEAVNTRTFTVGALPAPMAFSAMTPAAGALVQVSNPTVSLFADADEKITAVSATINGTPKSVSFTYKYYPEEGYWYDNAPPDTGGG